MLADATEIESIAPLRVSFVGGGTDFPHWYEEHGGAVLSTTIDSCVRVTLSPRADRQVRVRSVDLGHLVQYHLDDGPQYDGIMDLAKAAVERIGVARGIDMSIRSQAPPGSGLGGSSALVTAVVAALAALANRDLTADELARACYAIEREELAIAGGWQDQYAAAFGGFNLLEFSSAGVSVSPVRASREVISTLDANLLLCYTGGVRRNVGLVAHQIELHRQGREDTLLGMKQLHEMAYAMRDAVERGHPDALGSMLRDAFEAKKRMNPHITEDTPIESMLARAQACGAIGGKVCGAGGGGYLLLYCRPEDQPGVRRELERLGGQFAPFAFDARGVRAIKGDRVWTPA